MQWAWIWSPIGELRSHMLHGTATKQNKTPFSCAFTVAFENQLNPESKSVYTKNLLSFIHGQFSLVQLLSRVRLFAASWTAACQASLSISNSWSLPKLMSIESVMPSNHLGPNLHLNTSTRRREIYSIFPIQSRKGRKPKQLYLETQIQLTSFFSHLATRCQHSGWLWKPSAEDGRGSIHPVTSLLGPVSSRKQA